MNYKGGGKEAKGCQSAYTHSFGSTLSEYENVMKRLLYACDYCDGALIQVASCIVCKRSVVRSCKNCNFEIRTSHAMCRTSAYDSSLTNSRRAEVKI